MTLITFTAFYLLIFTICLVIPILRVRPDYKEAVEQRIEIDDHNWPFWEKYLSKYTRIEKQIKRELKKSKITLPDDHR